MSMGDAILEHVLFGITLLLGIASVFDNDSFIFLMVWMIVLGFFQVLHSFVIGSCYWKKPRIRKAITLYWIVAGSELLIFFILVNDLFFLKLEFLFWFFVLVIPLALATYLWAITWYFSRKPVDVNLSSHSNKQDEKL